MKVNDPSIEAIRFARWMVDRETEPTVDAVKAFMRCSRATAYRWLQRWRIAAGATPWSAPRCCASRAVRACRP